MSNFADRQLARSRLLAHYQGDGASDPLKADQLVFHRRTLDDWYLPGSVREAIEDAEGIQELGSDLDPSVAEIAQDTLRGQFCHITYRIHNATMHRTEIDGSISPWVPLSAPIVNGNVLTFRQEDGSITNIYGVVMDMATVSKIEKSKEFD